MLWLNLGWCVLRAPHWHRRYSPGLPPPTWLAIPIFATTLAFLVPVPVPGVMVQLGLVSALVDGVSRRLPLELSLLLAAELVLTSEVDLLGALWWAAPLAVGARWGQVGRGDVILAAVLGLGSGPAGLAVALAAALLFAAVTRSRQALAFGPFLLLGAVCGAGW